MGRKPLRKHARESSNEDIEGKKKKQKVVEDENSENDSDEENNEDDIDLTQRQEDTIEEFTFEFNDMRENYFHGLKTLVLTTLAEAAEGSNVADKIVSQATVGTVVNSEGEEDVFAYATILPIQELQNSPLITSVFRGTEALPLGKYRTDNKFGFLLHNRFTNFPPQLIYDLHRNLLEDITWAKSINLRDQKNSEDLEIDIIRMFQGMDKCFMLAPCSFSDSTISSPPQFGNVLGRNDILFHNFEDDFYFQSATEAYYVKVPTEKFRNQENVLIIITLHDLDKVVSELKKMVL